MTSHLSEFREVWIVKFVCSASPGERPCAVCLVARELRTGQTYRMSDDELRARRAPPYPTDPDVLFVAYAANLELAGHINLGWPTPKRVLDLDVEFRNSTNGREPYLGNGLMGALGYHGLAWIAGMEKPALQHLAKRGGPWSASERDALLTHCEQRVQTLHELLVRMLPTIDLPRALIRGRYMTAVAHMEREGIPLDVPT